MISLSEITRVYSVGEAEVRALDGIDLEIAENELVAIMGSSGSGKSTLMNVIGCLDRPSSGKYVLLGREVSRLNRTELAGVRNHTLGFVFQSFNLLTRTSAMENVELPMLYAGLSTPERRRRAAEALTRVGLQDRMEHLPNQLSGGQQQRVAIARAIANGPRIILADEPTGNLDSRTSTGIMELFLELRAGGMTIVLVTHEADIAAYGTRVIWMKDGRIERDEVRKP